MNIQALMNKGDPNNSFLEKVADAVNILPRAMWCSKRLTVINSKDSTDGLNLQFEKNNTITNRFWGKNGLGFIGLGSAFGGLAMLVTGVTYAVLSVIAAPCLGIGLALKKIALLKNERAQSYSHIVSQILQEQYDAKQLKKAVAKAKKKEEIAIVDAAINDRRREIHALLKKKNKLENK
ncbi:MAG: hypothetical protein H0X29_12105 [Parachlamydiaceae bacterium]|nr:hypothetical protein [Parachlamydiaceae bacterium]